MPDDDIAPPPMKGQRDIDARTECWFCPGVQAVALAPRHTGGDEDEPAHWIPVCEEHLARWHDEVDAHERLPIIPRWGVGLSKEHAEAIYAAICEDTGEMRDSVNQEVDGLADALDSLQVSLNALENTTGMPSQGDIEELES